MMSASGIVLAGGRSLRMGQDKTLLYFQNETLIRRIVKELQSVVNEVIIASNQTAKYNIDGVSEVPDVYQNKGPLGGLHAGLLAVKSDYAFVTAGDMPFFTAELATYLMARKDGYDAIVPQIRGNWEPLCAVYSRNCIGPIKDCLQADIRKVFRFYPKIRVLAVSEDELKFAGLPAKIFYNLNTPEDLEILRKGELL
jgi:molybdenum cofactor guanylyltransferase